MTSRRTIPQAIETGAKRQVAGVRVARAGRIVKYDAAAQRCDVQLVHNEIRTLPDGTYIAVDAPLIRNAPVAMPAGGDTSFTFGLAAGDAVQVVIRDISHDEYDAGKTSGTYTPDSRRRFNVDDAIVWPFATPPSRMDGAPVIAFGEGLVLRLGAADADKFIALAEKVADRIFRLEGVVNVVSVAAGTGTQFGPVSPQLPFTTTLDVQSLRVATDG